MLLTTDLYRLWIGLSLVPYNLADDTVIQLLRVGYLSAFGIDCSQWTYC